MQEAHKREVLHRLRTVRGHIDAVIAMVDGAPTCAEVMKQVAALQASLERVNRIVIQDHLDTRVAEAVNAGRLESILDGLAEASGQLTIELPKERGG